MRLQLTKLLVASQSDKSVSFSTQTTTAGKSSLSQTRASPLRRTDLQMQRSSFAKFVGWLGSSRLEVRQQVQNLFAGQIVQ